MSNPRQYLSPSRGYKTKGNKYKDRYVEKTCPECGHHRAYKDTWKTRIAYTCLKRSCRHKWYVRCDINGNELEEEPKTEVGSLEVK